MRTTDHCSPLAAVCHGEFVLVWAHHCIRANEPVVYAQHRVLETCRTWKETKAFHRRDSGGIAWPWVCILLLLLYVLLLLSLHSVGQLQHLHYY